MFFNFALKFSLVNEFFHESKGKDRPARTPHVAFVVASHYRLQITFLLSQAKHFSEVVLYIFQGQNKEPHPFHVKSNWMPPVQPSIALESD